MEKGINGMKESDYDIIDLEAPEETAYDLAGLAETPKEVSK